MVIPLHQLKAVNPSTSRSNPSEKYVQVISVDNHEFWFMGFLNYEGAIKNLQDALETRVLQSAWSQIVSCSSIWDQQSYNSFHIFINYLSYFIVYKKGDIFLGEQLGYCSFNFFVFWLLLCRCPCILYFDFWSSL